MTMLILAICVGMCQINESGETRLITSVQDGDRIIFQVVQLDVVAERNMGMLLCGS
jgi:hypothetical protein